MEKYPDYVFLTPRPLFLFVFLFIFHYLCFIKITKLKGKMEEAEKYIKVFNNDPKECAIMHIDEVIKHIREIESILKLSGIVTLIIDSKISHLNKIKEVLLKT